MSPFLISSALGFTVYQLTAWALISDDRLFVRFAGFVISWTPEAATWLRRIFGVLLVGLVLSLAFWLHKPFIDLDNALGGTVVFGFFFGPLLAIWTNTLLAKPSGESLSTGQYIAGAGLVLLFLVGSVGSPTGALIQGYARKISKISVGGAELAFSERSSETSRLGGSLPLSGATPTFASTSGAIGLDYLSNLIWMIHRDGEYLRLFAKIELQREEAQPRVVDLDGRQTSQSETDKKKENIKGILSSLDDAQKFAENTIRPPAACLVGWYSVSGDAQSINRHIDSLGDVFKRLPTIELGHPVSELSERFIQQSFLIAVDAVASVPSALLGDKCDDLLEKFCPSAFVREREEYQNDLGSKEVRDNRKRNADEMALPNCLRALQSGQNNQSSSFASLRESIDPLLTGFVKSHGWEARPYYAIGYASILAQLGQNQAASALLDGWVRSRAKHPKPAWITAADWFEVRTRSILVNFLEDWLKKEGQAAPTALRNEHVANLNAVRTDLKARLSDVDFFRSISATQRSEVRLNDPGACRSNDPDIVSWRRLFETYITAELTYLVALTSHPNYAEQFSEQATGVARGLAGMDLSCIPLDLNPKKADLVHPKAKTLYAQILDAFGSNAYLYSEAHRTLESEQTRQRRVVEAIQVVEYARDLIADVARRERDRNGQPFLDRIAASDAVEVEEKLNATEKKLKKIKDNQE